MLYKRQLGQLGQLRTMQRHTLLAENLGQCNATLCLQRTLILAYDATASTDSLSLLKCKKSCPKFSASRVWRCNVLVVQVVLILISCLKKNNQVVVKEEQI